MASRNTSNLNFLDKIPSRVPKVSRADVNQRRIEVCEDVGDSNLSDVSNSNTTNLSRMPQSQLVDNLAGDKAVVPPHVPQVGTSGAPVHGDQVYFVPHVYPAGYLNVQQGNLHGPPSLNTLVPAQFLQTWNPPRNWMNQNFVEYAGIDDYGRYNYQPVYVNTESRHIPTKEATFAPPQQTNASTSQPRKRGHYDNTDRSRDCISPVPNLTKRHRRVSEYSDLENELVRENKINSQSPQELERKIVLNAFLRRYGNIKEEWFNTFCYEFNVHKSTIEEDLQEIKTSNALYGRKESNLVGCLTKTLHIAHQLQAKFGLPNLKHYVQPSLESYDLDKAEEVSASLDLMSKCLIVERVFKLTHFEETWDEQLSTTLRIPEDTMTTIMDELRKDDQLNYARHLSNTYDYLHLFERENYDLLNFLIAYIKTVKPDPEIYEKKHSIKSAHQTQNYGFDEKSFICKSIFLRHPNLSRYWTLEIAKRLSINMSQLKYFKYKGKYGRNVIRKEVLDMTNEMLQKIDSDPIHDERFSRITTYKSILGRIDRRVDDNTMWNILFAVRESVGFCELQKWIIELECFFRTKAGDLCGLLQHEDYKPESYIKKDNDQRSAAISLTPEMKRIRDLLSGKILSYKQNRIENFRGVSRETRIAVTKECQHFVSYPNLYHSRWQFVKDIVKKYKVKNDYVTNLLNFVSCDQNF